MKIKVTEKPYSEVAAIPPYKHKEIKPQPAAARMLLNALSTPELRKTDFSARFVGMEKLGENEACMVLMNHSSFIDLKIASHLLRKRPFHIICTSDGFVGKEALMRFIGCVPTRKFQSDINLVRDLRHILSGLQSSVLMFPEASYSFDGTATPLPESLGKCLKLLGVPVVMIRTYGAFHRDPLYNNLRLRQVKVSAEMKYLLSPDDIASMNAEQINEVLKTEFSFDSFRWQQEEHIRVDEDFRATDLNRVLYKCPQCGSEGSMRGEGTKITCNSCGAEHFLSEYGELVPLNCEAKFTHIPDWYNWERSCVREEILRGDYLMELPVDILMMVDMKSIYAVGSGVLRHDETGFTLSGCGGELSYHQAASASYSLYADYYWYERGDVISIGTNSALYYCLPQNCGDVVAKARLAAEELYKLSRKKTAKNDPAQ